MSRLTPIVDRLHRRAYRIAYPLATIWWRMRGHDGLCIAVWWDDRLLAVRHSYKPGLSMPAGSAKSGEATIHAAVRELREEVGLIIDPAKLTEVMKVDSAFGPLTFFETHLAEEPALAVDHREIIYAGFHRPDEIFEPVGRMKVYICTRRG